MRRTVLLIFVLASLAGCGNLPSPTEPADCQTSLVFAQEAFYAERVETESDFKGKLEWRNTPPSPNGRDHRYFLNGTPVYSGGTFTEPAFKAAVGAEVVIKGKLVDVGHGPEVWAGALTSCR